MFQSTEITISGKVYRIERLDVFSQWDVARKLLPVVTGAADVLITVFKAFGDTAAVKDRAEADARWEEAKVGIKQLFNTKVGDVIGPLSAALSAMSDADSRFIINTCLSKVRVQQDTGGWAALMLPGNILAFQDLELPAMLMLVMKVLESNLSPFSPSPPGGLN